MPAPAIYVVGAVATAAVGFALYKFVFEPHIAPELEAWAESFLARRRRQRQRVPVPVHAYAEYHGSRSRHSRQSSHDMEPLINLSGVEHSQHAQDNQLRHRRLHSQQESGTQFAPSNSNSRPHVQLNRSQPSSPISATRRTSTSSNSFRLPTPEASQPSSPHMATDRPLGSLSSPPPGHRANTHSVSSISASEIRSPSLTASDVFSVSDAHTSSAGRSHIQAVTDSPTFDHPVILSPPPQHPASEPSLSDIDVLSVHSDSDDDSDLTGSVSSWESTGDSPRLH